ncbi:MAG: GDP-mannose 4,6-dehydratase [Acidobacteria bacterium]|nr:GDP-mannose 4,6-dehydratase [Acidobacteriota bacterium]
MKVLITGFTGFAGSHLADYILAKHPDVEVYGIKRWRSRTENIDHLRNEKRVKILHCDFRDPVSVYNTLKEVRPDRIFHLGAQSFVPTSWEAPSDTMTTNIMGEINIFEAMKELGLKDTRVQIACSSEEYGHVNEDEVPIKETNPLRPLSPYAVSKVTQDYLAYQYHKSYGFFTVRTRGFNHTGPRRGDVFVISDFSKQIAEAEKGKREPVMYVGNLQAKRDFTDVRDMVRAYWLSLEKCDPGDVYNIASNSTHTIQSCLDRLIALSEVKIEVKQDPKRMRPSDVMILYGDNTKFCEKTGWKPEIPFDKTLEDTLNFWRERV